MFPRAIKIMSLMGFDIKIDPSWIIIAALITWSLAQQVFPQLHPGFRPEAYYTMAFIAMILFFVSLILHEMSHAYVARRYGLEIDGITLFVFGGVAELVDEPKTAISEFWIAIAGPIMSLFLSVVFNLWASALTGATADVISYLAAINLILALFNLLPAFPLDGGRVLRAYLWWRSNDILKATRMATRAGEILAYVLIGLGLFTLFQGAVVSGLWQVLIGGFLLAAARSTYQAHLLRVGLRNETVSSLMSPEPATVSPDQSLAELVNQIMLRHRVSFVPVVETGALLGYVDSEILAKIDRENWPTTRVGDVYSVLNEDSIVSPNLAASDLMTRILKSKRRKFMVTDGNTLVGVVTLSDLTSYLAVLQSLTGAQHPEVLENLSRPTP